MAVCYPGAEGVQRTNRFGMTMNQRTHLRH